MGGGAEWATPGTERAGLGTACAGWVMASTRLRSGACAQSRGRHREGSRSACRPPPHAPPMHTPTTRSRRGSPTKPLQLHAVRRHARGRRCRAIASTWPPCFASTVGSGARASSATSAIAPASSPPSYPARRPILCWRRGRRRRRPCEPRPRALSRVLATGVPYAPSPFRIPDTAEPPRAMLHHASAARRRDSTRDSFRAHGTSSCWACARMRQLPASGLR